MLNSSMSRKRIAENSIRLLYIVLGWGILIILSFHYPIDYGNPVFIFLAVAIIVSNGIPLDIGVAQLTQAFAFEYLLMMILGPISAAWLSVIGIIGQGVASRQKKVEWYLLNSAIHSLSIIGAGAVFYNTGGRELLISDEGIINPVFILPVLAGAVTHFCLNIGMVYPLIYVRHGKTLNQRELWGIFHWDFLAKLFFAFLAYYIYLVYGQSSVKELIPPVVFLLAMWIFIRKSMELTVTKRKLSEHIEHIKALREIGIIANSKLDLQHAINTVVDRISELYSCRLSVIHLTDDHGNIVKPSAMSGQGCSTNCGLLTGHRYLKLINTVLKKSKPFVTNNPKTIKRLFDSVNDNEKCICNIGSVVVYPLTTDNEKVGTVTLASKKPYHFKLLSGEIIDFIAQELSGSIANARLHSDLKRAYNERGEELNLAARVQRDILPSDFMTEHVKIGTKLSAAKILGGDLFEIAQRHDGLIAIAVGDVSGKGVPAALTMMRIISLLRRLCREAQSSIDVLRVLNRELDWESHESEEDDDFHQYATCFFMLFNPRTGLMRYSSAGHVRPLLYSKRRDELTFLTGGGFPLGMFPDGNFNLTEIVLNPGDKIIMYTDGATDTVNSKGKRFNIDQLKTVVKHFCQWGTKDIATDIHNQIMEYKGDAPLADDVAIISLDYLGGPVDEMSKLEAIVERDLSVVANSE